ncbi:3637_t:CDS:2 [Ambispora gerdemannii]|uniref:3637_t:CDS:1 n=1 Tax=Ambispora gerdemannii TaxID=144530 RepID=A0A9N9CXU9_9GLOM|nr:3637_t:CDS:2 [Ambispora gerdemannii]
MPLRRKTPKFNEFAPNKLKLWKNHKHISRRNQEYYHEQPSKKHIHIIVQLSGKAREAAEERSRIVDLSMRKFEGISFKDEECFWLLAGLSDGNFSTSMTLIPMESFEDIKNFFAKGNELWSDSGETAYSNEAFEKPSCNLFLSIDQLISTADFNEETSKRNFDANIVENSKFVSKFSGRASKASPWMKKFFSAFAEKAKASFPSIKKFFSALAEKAKASFPSIKKFFSALSEKAKASFPSMSIHNQSKKIFQKNCGITSCLAGLRSIKTDACLSHKFPFNNPNQQVKTLYKFTNEYHLKIEEQIIDDIFAQTNGHADLINFCGRAIMKLLEEHLQRGVMQAHQLDIKLEALQRQLFMKGDFQVQHV